MPTISLIPPSGRYLSFGEREEIALLRAFREGIREIARSLGRAPSTISRKLRRNVATRGGKLEYRASVQWKAEFFAHRSKPAKLDENDRLRDNVQGRLAGNLTRPDGTSVKGPEVRFTGRKLEPRKDRSWSRAWSPEQISNRLQVDFPDDEPTRISHEAIYQALYVQERARSSVNWLAAFAPRARTQTPAGTGSTEGVPRPVPAVPQHSDDQSACASSLSTSITSSSALPLQRAAAVTIPT